MERLVWTLRRVSGEGAPVPATELRSGQRIRLGRHHSNEVVLKGAPVSRFHATLVWPEEEEGPYLLDNGSANGTLLDGKPAESRVPLRNGSLIQIGDHELTVGLRREQEETGLQDVLFESAELVMVWEKHVEIDGILLETAALHRLLLDLEEHRRTGTLSLTLGDDEVTVTYCMGRIAQVVYNDRKGNQAFLMLMGAEHGGAYSFKNSFRASDEFLDLSAKETLNRLSNRKSTGRFQKLSLMGAGYGDMLEPAGSDDGAEDEEELVDQLGLLSGTFSGNQIRDVLQMLGAKERTGVLQLVLEEGRGRIVVDQGLLVGATFGELSGPDAAKHMLRDGQGAFRFRPMEAPARQFPPVSMVAFLTELRQEGDEVPS